MKFKFAIGNTVEVPVKFSVNDGAKTSSQTVTLVCDRMSEEERKDSLKDGGLSVTDFMTKVTTGWKDQRFLLGEDDRPAEFSADALAALFSFPGLAVLAFTTYLKESGAKEKN